eukprot:2157325-Alexandrium_andersonii.AAC.1
MSSSLFSELTLLHVNIQGFSSHKSELEARLLLLPSPPTMICTNETFLDRASHPSLPQYTVVARRDRGSHGGGVLVLVKSSLAGIATVVHSSEAAERVWLVLHTDL